MKLLLIIVIGSLALLAASCMENKSESKNTELETVFP